MSTPGSPITQQSVQAAAVLADLRLSEERAAAVAGLLAAWVPAANVLSTRMQSSDLDGLMPAVVFTQGPAAGDGDGETSRRTGS